MDELYLTGVVIANGIPDADNDTLNSKEIKTIFTKYTNHLTDVMHDRIDYGGMNVLANWISETETKINDTIVPAKSWLATVKLTNPEIIKSVMNEDLTTFSLGSIHENAMKSEEWSINKRLTYKDLKNIDEIIPLRISLVDKGACGIPFEIVNYKEYINKRDDTMTNENKGNFSLKDIKDILSFFKSELSIDKSVEENKEESKSEMTIEALFEKIDNIDNRINKIESKIDAIEETEINKESEENKKEEETEEVEEIDEEENKDEKNKEINKKGENTDKVKNGEHNINKNDATTTKVHDNVINTVEVKSFYERTGRDQFGRKIRH